MRLTRRTAGDERPKQFCLFVGAETLLDRTRARVARSVRPDRTCLVLTSSHEPFYPPLLAKGPGQLGQRSRREHRVPERLRAARRHATTCWSKDRPSHGVRLWIWGVDAPPLPP